MQNTWHTPKKILIAVEVIAKNSRYPDLPAPSPLGMLVLRQLLLRLQKIFNISMYYPPAV